MTVDTDTNNVDPAEIAKFESLASRWWDKNSEFKPLHAINPLRSQFIDERSPVAEMTVLDVGCGGGILSESLAQRGAQVTGIDRGEAPLAVARLHAQQTGLDIDYQCISAEALANERAERFDIVTCMEMLEHVPDPAAIVAACARLAKPGGHVYFSTINRNPKAYAFAILGAEYVLKLLPKGTHDYHKFIRPAELAQWVRNSHLQWQDITGMTYNPITKRYRLNADDVSVNYWVHTQKPAAL
ncbi:MAG: bifunctional 2-polyprenyl-6-hydroxyphenol methylase/3-demethylubiquinol 3-O-methyltransferase UbiG [Cellvibrionaceae bacterium]|nr:bifunctional 2-polyprenyl-6-hydroxyphenol methylase/3-demethylubiquinol 3-O-methyltransferase UbiG [Cellvibrionaceae bacterium]